MHSHAFFSAKIPVQYKKQKLSAYYADITELKENLTSSYQTLFKIFNKLDIRNLSRAADLGVEHLRNLKSKVDAALSGYYFASIALAMLCVEVRFLYVAHAKSVLRELKRDSTFLFLEANDYVYTLLKSLQEILNKQETDRGLEDSSLVNSIKQSNIEETLDKLLIGIKTQIDKIDIDYVSQETENSRNTSSVPKNALKLPKLLPPLPIRSNIEIHPSEIPILPCLRYDLSQEGSHQIPSFKALDQSIQHDQQPIQGNQQLIISSFKKTKSVDEAEKIASPNKRKHYRVSKDKKLLKVPSKDLNSDHTLPLVQDLPLWVKKGAPWYQFVYSGLGKEAMQSLSCKANNSLKSTNEAQSIYSTNQNKM